MLKIREDDVKLIIEASNLKLDDKLKVIQVRQLIKGAITNAVVDMYSPVVGDLIQRVLFREDTPVQPPIYGSQRVL